MGPRCYSGTRLGREIDFGDTKTNDVGLIRAFTGIDRSRLWSK
jgi:hypothetical protein